MRYTPWAEHLSRKKSTYLRELQVEADVRVRVHLVDIHFVLEPHKEEGPVTVVPKADHEDFLNFSFHNST